MEATSVGLNRKAITCIVAVIVAIILIIGYQYFRKSPYNVVAYKSGNEVFYVNREFGNPEAAAKAMEEINKRTYILMQYLKDKYRVPNVEAINPDKGNVIDVVNPPHIEEISDSRITPLRTRLSTDYIIDRIDQLFRNYNEDDVFEANPFDLSGTSYMDNKKTLILCLRNTKNPSEIHDINTLMFCIIHERTHSMNNNWGHGKDFWVLFKFMLIQSVEAGIYIPVNYAQHPINYCNKTITLTYNPLYDPAL